MFLARTTSSGCRAPAGRACWSSTASAGNCCARTAPRRHSWPGCWRPGAGWPPAFPSTTVTSLGSLGTGRPPGQHGMLGYQVRVPATGQLLNALRWDKAVDPDRVAAGNDDLRAGGRCGRRRVPGGGRGLPADRAVGSGHARRRLPRGRYPRRAGRGRAQPRSRPCRARCSMVYTGDLDSTGHACGCTSPAWRFQLAHVDRLAEQLAGALPPGTALHVTADHGMVDVPAVEPDRRGPDPGAAGRASRSWAGSRARATSTPVPGAAADVLAAWRATLGDRAWTVSREEADRGGLVRAGRAGDGRPDRRCHRRGSRAVGGGRDRCRAARVGASSACTARSRRPISGCRLLTHVA